MKLLILLTSLLLSVSVFAQDGGKQNPCKADAQKFCANAPTINGHKGKCLREHTKELSPACLVKLESFKAKMESAGKDQKKIKK